LLLSAGACRLEPDELGQSVRQGTTLNGLTSNGLTSNGLTSNGLTSNGLTSNGLTSNGLTSNGAFAPWFNSDIPLHDSVMSYIVKCALRPDQSTSFVDANNVSHSWSGLLGLAQSWFDGPATDDQKSWVSACLLAHVNSAPGGTPKHIQLSVRAAPVAGVTDYLAVSGTESAALGTFDGAFFADLFSDPNTLYACSPTYSSGMSAVDPVNTVLADWGRQCSVDGYTCPGLAITFVDCSSVCTVAPAGSTYKYGPTCTVGGRTFNVLNVFTPNVSEYVTAGPEPLRWQLSGGVATNTNCTHCLNGNALTGFSGTSNAAAALPNFTPLAGSYLLDVRYANGATTKNGSPVTTYLQIKVNGAVVQNGSSALWDFPPTGGADTWSTRTIPVTLSSNGSTISLVGPGRGVIAPPIDLVSLRLP
jgi:hypothetical protein